ncbi:MAG: dUTP diphosphatase [Alphaproteobacteria bacterium]|nr:dUTP diphosphatase [Alphaproteobacteria bacterium]
MAQVLKVSIARTADGNGLPLPTYSSQYHAGLNLQAAVPAALRLEPGDRAYVPAGIAVGIPDGYCGFIISQPVLAREKGLVVLDAPQIIHPADRGPLFILLQNMSSHLVVLHRGDVIAQLVVEPIVQVSWKDLSNGVNAGKAISEQEVIVDSLGDRNETKKGNSKMISSRRVYKNPRHRFSESDEKNE